VPAPASRSASRRRAPSRLAVRHRPATAVFPRSWSYPRLSLPSRSGIGTGMMGPMHVHTRGPVDGPPVLLIHGNCSSALYWEPLVRGLPETWRIVMPDLRGYGESDPLPVDGSRGLRDFADDVAAVLSDGSFAPGARPVLVGHSMVVGVALPLRIDHPAHLPTLLPDPPASPSPSPP